MTEQENKNIILNTLDACGELVKHRYRRSVRSIYGVSKSSDKRPRFIGTCTFVRNSEKHFLVTAAHIYDHSSINTLYVLDDGFVEFDGIFHHTIAPESYRSNDFVDLALLELSTEMLENLKITEFISQAEFLIGNLASNQKYGTVLGYPESKHKNPVSKHRDLKVQLYCYTDMVFEIEKYSEIPEFSPGSHIILRHNAQHANDPDGNKVSSYGTKGVSGGGLFIVEAIITRGALEPQSWNTWFAGILIERRKQKKALIFTNATSILQVMEYAKTASLGNSDGKNA